MGRRGAPLPADIDKGEESVKSIEQIRAQLGEVQADLEAQIQAIDDRIAVAQAERDELQRLLTSLGRDQSARAPRGRRKDQLLESVREEPGHRASYHAEKIGISKSQVYPLVKQLMTEGKIVRTGEDSELHVAEEDAAA